MSIIKARTGNLRTSSKAIPKRVRMLLREKGVDIATSYLAQMFQDDSSLEFGIVVTPQRQIFQFDFDWFGKPIEEGKFVNWREMWAEYPSHCWDKEISSALQIIEEANRTASNEN